MHVLVAAWVREPEEAGGRLGVKGGATSNPPPLYPDEQSLNPSN